MSLKKSSTRFRYNQGVYQIRALVGDTWQQMGPEIGGSFAKCSEVLSEYQRENPNTLYSLFYLQQDGSNAIQWVRATSDSFYFKNHRDELLRIFKRLNLRMDDHGYSVLARITNISKSSIVKMLRPPSDPRFQAVTSEGMIYIRYRVNEAIISGTIK